MPNLNEVHHVMVDLETLALEEKSVILSWATGIYNEKWEEVDSLTTNLLVLPQILKGRTIDPKTVAWWDTQDPKAIAALQSNQLHPLDAIQKHFALVSEHREKADVDILFWGNSYSFDLYKINSLLGDFAPEICPIDDYKMRCFRSTRDVFKFYFNVVYNNSSTTHIAIDDVRQQAAFMRSVMELGFLNKETLI